MRKDYHRNQSEDNRQSAEDKAMDRFVELMIERLQDIQQDWQKPWFSENAIIVPRNLSGRKYNGMNSVMLMLHCQRSGYELPVFCTFDRVTGLNYTKDKKGARQQVVDGNGEKLPQVSVNKGEKSFPVFITTFTCVHSETRERISYDDYKMLSEEERQNYKVYPKLQVYNVFNVDQTNLKESRPELYAKLQEQCRGPKREGELKGEAMPAIDVLIKENGWYCPIHEVHGDDAYYSISRDEIVLPERDQFDDIESFEATLFHEAAHSTGSENRLNRLKPATFGSAEYAAEELKAELSAAFVAANYGIVKPVKSDSLPYLKSWLDSLHQSPDFLKTILMDVKRASGMLIQRIDGIQQRIDMGLPPVAEEWKAEHEPSHTIATGTEHVAARALPKTEVSSLAAEEVKTKLDKFMQQYYYAARFDNGTRVTGIVDYEGKPALKLSVDKVYGDSHFLVTHEQDAEQKDHFFLRHIDDGKEVGKSREMPHDRDEAHDFMRDAVSSYKQYESSKEATRECEQEKYSHHGR